MLFNTILIILLLLASYTNTQCVRSTPILTSQSRECLNKSDTDSICCIHTQISSTTYSECKPHPRLEVLVNNTYTNSRNVSYYIDCGSDSSIFMETKELSKCGPIEPKGEEDCWKYSSEDNSCCYYTYSTDKSDLNNDKDKLYKGCSFAGFKFKGKSIMRKHLNMSITCDANIINITLSYILVVIFLII